MPGGALGTAAKAREGGHASAELAGLGLDPMLANRERLLRAAVAAVTQALGEQGATYRRHLHEWVETHSPS